MVIAGTSWLYQYIDEESRTAMVMKRSSVVCTHKRMEGHTDEIVIQIVYQLPGQISEDIVIPFSLILHFLIHSSASKEGVSFDTLGTNPAKVLSKGICKNEMGNVKNECIPYGPASFSDVNPQV